VRTPSDPHHVEPRRQRFKEHPHAADDGDSGLSDLSVHANIISAPRGVSVRMHHLAPMLVEYWRARYPSERLFSDGNMSLDQSDSTGVCVWCPIIF
jgi:hypothetical protein